MASRAELAQERGSRPTSASEQQRNAVHRAEVATAAAADRARIDAEELREALAARDAELQRLQVQPEAATLTPEQRGCMV